VSTSTLQANLQYAGFWRRFAAIWLDAFLFIILSAPFMYLLVGHEYFFWLAGNEERLANISAIPFFLHKLAFFVVVFIFWNVMSTTPGKLLMGCHIVDADTLQAISRKQALIRLASYFVSALPFYLGFVWAAWDKRKQGLHDKLAKTVVLYHCDNYANQSIEELQNEFFNEHGKVM
jgi:uncharacterized RDD family membrane protein YckC